jgi:anti-anti-sigma factor
LAARQFEAEVTTRGDIAIVVLHGELSAGVEETLNGAYSSATEQHAARILLKFEDVDYINSTGIALIVGLLSKARRDGIHMMAVGLSDHYRQIFEITRLADFISIFSDEETALASVPAQSGQPG